MNEVGRIWLELCGIVLWERVEDMAEEDVLSRFETALAQLEKELTVVLEKKPSEMVEGMSNTEKYVI